MRILIIGPLGAGKSSLAYEINKRFDLPRLNLDEVCRNSADGSYYSKEEQLKKLNSFIKKNSNWVAEGCQRNLYKALTPDIIVDMRLNRLIAIWRFTTRFWKAKKLIGKTIPADAPVQVYHYRKITLKKIHEYDNVNQQINAEITDFLKQTACPVIRCRGRKEYPIVFSVLNSRNTQNY